MSKRSRCIRKGFPRAALSVAVLLALPLAGLAQSAPTSSSTSASMDMPEMQDMGHANMPGTDHGATDHSAMDHGGMPGMHAESMPAVDKRVVVPSPAVQPATIPPMSHAAVPGMPPVPAKDGGHAAMDHAATKHAAMPGTDHAGASHVPMTDMNQSESPAPESMSGMHMGAMQGGSAPADARSPDYSDGVGYGPMKPHLHGNDAVGMLLLDQLEAAHGRHGNAQAWEVQGWYGPDENKLWLRSEGERSQGKVEDGNLEVLWNHAIATYWGTQLGVRHDFGAGPGRDWAAFGVQGLAPYWFELEATGYVGAAGRTAARLRADYEVLFTQRLILQPELELNLYGKDDPARGIGRGLSDVQFGLRLRYEIRREFAPYVGINWVRRIGTTANYARADGQPVFDPQFVAGFRIWF